MDIRHCISLLVLTFVLALGEDGEDLQQIPEDFLMMLNSVKSSQELFDRFVRLETTTTTTTTTPTTTTNRRVLRPGPSIHPGLVRPNGRIRPGRPGRGGSSFARGKPNTGIRRTRRPAATTPETGAMEHGPMIPGMDEFDQHHVRSPIAEMISSMAAPSRCAPHNASVPLLDILPVKRNEVFWPRCVLLQRCGGCCVQAQTCLPAETVMLTFKVGRFEFMPESGTLQPVESLEVELEQHLQCTCGCKVKAEHCDAVKHNYLPHECRCQCKDEKEKAKCPGQGKVWNNAQCSCVCPQNPTPICDADMEFKADTCRCEATRAVNEPIPMPGEEPQDNCVRNEKLDQCMGRSCSGDARPQLVQYSLTSSQCYCRRRRRNRN